MDALQVPRATPLDELPHLVALRCRSVSKTELDRLVRGALKCAIDAHGPVDTKHLTSAAKRITGSIHAFLRAQHQGLDHA
jgi:predicted nuclease of predicted toxin-antitoxin system